MKVKRFGGGSRVYFCCVCYIFNYELRLPDTICWKRKQRKSIGKLLEFIESCEEEKNKTQKCQ